MASFCVPHSSEKQWLLRQQVAPPLSAFGSALDQMDRAAPGGREEVAQPLHGVEEVSKGTVGKRS